MSRPKNQAPASVPTGVDGATLVGGGTLTGVVKTTRGYALATATVMPDGTTVVTLGNSQAFKQFVVEQQKRAGLAGAMKA